LVNNPKTHITVKNRILDLIKTWANDFKGQVTLEYAPLTSYMNEVYQDLIAQGHQFPAFQPSPKRTTISEKEKEEEELQLALAMSLSAQETRRVLKC
jgi:signal transducing adaptor molecule